MRVLYCTDSVYVTSYVTLSLFQKYLTRNGEIIVYDALISTFELRYVK